MTLDDLLGPNWRAQVAGYSYHGQTGDQILASQGGAVQIGDYFLENDTDNGDFTAFKPSGSGDINYRFDAKTGQFKSQDQTSQFNDVAGVLSVLGVAAGGALLGAGGAGGEAAVSGEGAALGAGGTGVGVGGAGAGFESGVVASGATVGGPMSVGGATGTPLEAAGGGGALDLGGGMTSSDFSYGADTTSGFGGAGTTGGTLSSLGTALNGGTGFGSLLPLISSAIAGKDARDSGKTANDLANRLITASDPFAPYRAGYGQKLQALEASHDVTSIPGYQAGIQAVERAGAAQGFTGSGNMMKALQDYGGNFYNAELQRLAGLAGAGATPGAGFATGAGLIGAGQKQTAFGNQETVKAIGQGANFLSGLGQSQAPTQSPTPSVGDPLQDAGTPVGDLTFA